MSNSRFKDYLRAADREWHAAVHDYFLLYAAALLVLTSGLLMALGGHHAGFHNWQAAAHSVLTPWFWANITFVGDTLTALAIALLVALRFPKVALVTLLAAVIGGVTIQLIKYGLALPRPPVRAGLHIDRAKIKVGRFIGAHCHCVFDDGRVHARRHQANRKNSIDRDRTRSACLGWLSGYIGPSMSWWVALLAVLVFGLQWGDLRNPSVFGGSCFYGDGSHSSCFMRWATERRRS